MTLEEALAFTAEYHRQGVAIPGKNPHCYGLEYEDELLAVAIFCNPRTAGKQKEYTTELFRLTFKDGVRIGGGASKLIKHFMATGAWDLFTYQDTSGQAGSVYEHSGLTLIGDKAPKKAVMVRNGIAYKDADNNRRDWFSLEQVTRHGPDSLLGTSLGEIFDEEGVRKSNVRLFLEHCGYHLEEIPGDRIYEWRNPRVKFYAYKITSTRDDGYYYGRRAIRGESVTEEACLLDPYMGSGGRKFQSWVAHVGADSLKKEILGIYKTWKDIVKAEKRFIGSSHKEDPNCKNYQPGGTGMTRPPQNYQEKLCEIHGLTIFQGKVCVSCKNNSLIKLRNCSTHGETKHRGSACMRCVATSHQNLRECRSHGLVLHQAGACTFCAAQSAFTKGVCAIHGEVTFQGENCLKCFAEEKFTLMECLVHGLTKHHGSTCMTCTAQASINIKKCSIHGETKHKGDTCMKCSYERLRSERECPIHGMTHYVGNTCLKCNTASQISEKECATHGLSLHKGDSCTLCTGDKAKGTIVCPSHGETKASAGVCVKCRLSKHLEEKECHIHGLSKHRGGNCTKCSYAATFSERKCSIHGLTKHRGEKCMKCSSAKNWAKRRSNLENGKVSEEN